MSRVVGGAAVVASLCPAVAYADDGTVPFKTHLRARVVRPADDAVRAGHGAVVRLYVQEQHPGSVVRDFSVTKPYDAPRITHLDGKLQADLYLDGPDCSARALYISVQVRPRAEWGLWSMEATIPGPCPAFGWFTVNFTDDQARWRLVGFYGVDPNQMFTWQQARDTADAALHHRAYADAMAVVPQPSSYSPGLVE